MERGRERLEDSDAGLAVAVIGGGIAGLSAACVLAERGASVTVYEKEGFLGGRAGAWTDILDDGGGSLGTFEMERGFHAFFRQYYNLRALLRRVDPALDMLAPVHDYPICGPDGTESFARLSRLVPLNIAQLVFRTDTMGWRDLLRVNVRAAVAMLAYDQERVYDRYDTVTAGDYLDSLRFPPRARRMLFDVFAHSFFNPEGDMSAAELLMMFHFYFMGNPEGLLFDVARRPFSQALWQPLADYLEQRGARILLGQAVIAIEPAAGEARYRVASAQDSGGGEDGADDYDGVVLAVSVPALKSIVGSSPTLGDRRWRQQVDSLALTLPFAVWRLWLDRAPRADRAPFAGTTGVGILDNISVYELFEDESRKWATERGGSVIELHAYAVPLELDEVEIKRELLAGLHRLYPETVGSGILAERFLLRQDCPAFAPGSWTSRPGVVTPMANVTLAGDHVKLPMPSALMERAAASGFIAANAILADRGVRSEPIWSVPRRGIAPQWMLSRPTRARA